SNTTGGTWAGEHGMHFVSLGPTPFAKTNIDAFKQALAKRGGPAQPKAEFSGGTAIGVLRHICVADTDAEAKRFGKPAMELHLAQLNWLRDKHGVTGLTSRLNVPRGATFEDCVADGSVIAGTPQRVRDEIERQVGELGVNYLLTYLFLGTMTLEEAQRSLALFASEVMSRLAPLRSAFCSTPSVRRRSSSLPRTVRFSGQTMARGHDHDEQQGYRRPQYRARRSRSSSIDGVLHQGVGPRTGLLRGRQHLLPRHRRRASRADNPGAAEARAAGRAFCRQWPLGGRCALRQGAGLWRQGRGRPGAARRRRWRRLRLSLPYARWA